jgi:hypothetical protein
VRLTLAAAVIGGCGNAESQIERKATWLCRYGQLMAPVLTPLPDSEDPGDYLHPDDLAYLDSDMAEVGNADWVAAVRLKQAVQKPAAQAFAAIRALHTTCHVESIVVTGEVAEAVVRRSVPNLEDPATLTEVMAELYAIRFKQHRMAHAQERFASHTDIAESEHEITFRLTDGGWRAAFDLQGRVREMMENAGRLHSDAENAGDAAALPTPPDPRGNGGELAILVTDGVEPIRQGPTNGAVTPLEELAPAVTEKPPAAPEAVLSESIAGGWFRRPESDNTTIALAGRSASSSLHDGEPPPELQLRCPDGGLELSVAMGVEDGATRAGQTELAVSLNGRKAKKVRATAVGADGGFLFPRAGIWVKRLTRRKSHVLTVEAPLADSTVTAVFLLDGAAKAVRPILKACRKKRSERRSN